jgi:hypothetical protein
MDKRSEGSPAPSVRIVGVWAVAVLLAVAMTWPLASGIGHLGRTENTGDARYAVWNVAWVAQSLLSDPTRVYDANIFFPHRNALAFSEANLGAGVVALPAWALTRNPFTAFNFVVLFSFVASVVATFYLVQYLTEDTAGAWTAGIIYAFCPYLFSHTAHIQLLMPWGIPLSMLMLHRLVDAPTAARGVLLAFALAIQALSCAYYGIFAALMVGFATIFYAWSRSFWRVGGYWTAIGIAAVLSIGIVTPFFIPYLEIQQETGFARTLDDSRTYSANWRSYLASAAHLHNWMLPRLASMGGWNGEPLFPGFVAIVMGGTGVLALARASTSDRSVSRVTRSREIAVLYGALGLLALWASFGPQAGLYTMLYEVIPVFSFLRAPSRMGIVVMLSFAVFAAFGVRALRQSIAARWAPAVGLAAIAAALIDLAQMPFDWRAASPIPAPYFRLAELPRGPVAEFPFYDRRLDYHIHTRYMLNSTVHWRPLLNGYSDHIPADFRTLAVTLSSFPSRDAFDAMRERRVRYITLHRTRYGHSAAADVERRLQPFASYLKLIEDDGRMALYEVIGFPQ